MTSAQIAIMATIITYLCLVIFTGVMIGRRSKKSAEGFYLGGRSMGPLVTAMSAEASDMSSYLLMGIPGLAYLSGVADASWTAIGLAFGTYLNFLLVAKRLRRYSVKLDAITIPSFISRRYGEKKPVIMCISALIILVFFVPYVASGLAAIGKLFNSLFGWDYMLAVVIGAIVIISYTSVGGFSAVATMDLIQSIIMTIALCIIVVFGVVQAGGMDAVLEHARSLPGYLSFSHTYNVSTGNADPYGLIRIISISVKLGAITIPSFISKRYGEKKPVIMGISAVIILIFFVPYVASGLAAIGKLFNSLFVWDYMLAVIVGAIVIISYTSVGGFAAVATMDLIQSVIMTVALCIIVVFGVVQAGGMEAVLDHARSLPGFLSFVQTYNGNTGAAEPYGLIRIISMMAWGLGYFGMPHILVRFMAIREEKELVVSRRIASVWVVISMAVAVFIGIVGHGVSNAGRIPFLEGSTTETIIVRLSDLLSTYGIFPAIVAGCILAGILAATMSTADSQLLAASSAFSENVVQNVFGVKLTEKQNMLVARLTVVVIAIVAIFLAADPNSNVFQIVSFAWAGFGATFGPAVLCALFWKRSNRQGIMAGLVAGGVMIFVWKFAVRPLGGMFDIYELLPAFLCAAIAIVVVSLVTKAPEEEIVRTFEEVNAG